MKGRRERKGGARRKKIEYGPGDQEEGWRGGEVVVVVEGVVQER